MIASLLLHGVSQMYEVPENLRYKVRVSAFDFRLIRERRGHRNVYVSLDDVIAWAYKCKSVNDHPDIASCFQMVAEQFESLRDD